MASRTPLYQQHIETGARMVDFSGWDMPLHYGSQLEEHRRVREAAGVFDVSHMLAVELEGARAVDLLRYLLANDVAKLAADGRALYSCMLNDAGGVIDDLIVYRRRADAFRVVVNAGTADRDLAWMQRHAEPDGVRVTPRRDLAMLAVQGPQARAAVLGLLDPALRRAVEALSPFQAAESGELFIARTGYTGEDGVEIMLPAAAAPDFWRQLLAAGVVPVGLGARDTLRLEAGLNLYGQDMDETVTPLESNLGWTVAWEPAERVFIGRAALRAQRAAGVDRALVGVVLEDKGVLRAHQPVVIDGRIRGELTSGTFAPTLGRSIGLARVPAGASGHCEVDVRGRRLAARLAGPPFVRNGKILI
jgi:aminomethyltransferase